MVRIKHKFSVKRRRMDLSESTNIDFNFGSDEDEMAETVAAVAAVQMPDKLPITEQNITHGGLLLSAVKRQREGRSWATQDQPKKPHVESEVQESGEMPRGRDKERPKLMVVRGDPTDWEALSSARRKPKQPYNFAMFLLPLLALRQPQANYCNRQQQQQHARAVALVLK
ncbi:hypothetical protein PInf_026834 [Phytophthora infestans]|nr:hypothetical protein PInf_026834 [Phytophthora infestans]